MTSEVSEVSGLAYTPMNPFLRFINIYYSPKEVFTSLTRSKWVWIIPVVVVFLVGLACYPYMKSVMAEEIAQKMENSSLLEAMPEAERQEIVDSTRDSILNPPAWRLAIGVLGPIIGALAVGAILLLIGNIILGGRAKYAGMLNVYSFASLISIPETIIKTYLIHAKQTMDIRTSLAIILPSDDTISFVYAFFNKIDIFTIWLLSLIVIGMAVFLPKVSTKKIAVWVCAFWLLWVVIASAVSAFTGGAVGI